MRNIMSFTLTEDHIKLLQRAYIYFDDCAYDGAPAVNIKRPYGNSDVAGDVHEILTGNSEYEELSDEQHDAYLAIHKETAIALQIILVTGQFKPGKYVRTCQYNDRSWTPV